MRHTVTLGAIVVLSAAALPVASVAAADDIVQHNITYRARITGIARGALIGFRISDTQVNNANPTMLPGRMFEATGILTDPKEAGMRISIQWPYSASLHCEILVDDEIVIQADQFIAPRLTPAKDDPDYGAMNCGAPLSNATGSPLAPGDFPATDIPATDIPATDVPATDAPATGAPTTEIPATGAPAAQVPAADVPATDFSAPAPAGAPN
jgi:hypothetical protein